MSPILCPARRCAAWGLRVKRHGPQARTADLVDAPGCALDGQTGVDMRLARRVLALRGGQHLSEDGFRNFALFDPGAFHHRLKDGGAKIMGRGIGECATERAHSRAGRGCDYYIGHMCPPPDVYSVGGAPENASRHDLGFPRLSRLSYRTRRIAATARMSHVSRRHVPARRPARVDLLSAPRNSNPAGS